MLTITSPIESALTEKHWTPNKKQARFLAVPFDIDEAGYGGALMAGKSEVLMLMPLIYQFHEHAKFKGLFLRRTFPELEQEIIPRSQEYYPSTGAVYNVARHRWEWRNGAMDVFGHLKDEKDVKKYDTGQFSPVRWDEATSFTGFQYEYITLRRNRVPPGFPFPAFTRWGSNPGNVGHTYFRKRFIDPAKQGGVIIKESKTGSRRIFIPATAKDNPHGLEANPKYFQRLEGITSEAERRAMILGDWYTFEGQVFDEFRLEPLPDEPDNARHVIPYQPIPYWWPKLISIDWGMKAWTFIIWWAISPEGRVYIYRTYAIKGKKIKDWTRDMVDLTGIDVDQVRDIGICFSATNDIGNEQTLYEQCAEAMEDAGFKCSLSLGERNRVAGKQLVHEYLRWKPVEPLSNIIGDYDQELARKIERMHGSEALKHYVDYFTPPEPEYNLPRLQIFDKSPEGRPNDELIECIPACIYDEIKKEDVKEFDGDDPYDCLRIGLYRLRDYFDESKSEYERQQKIGLASAKFGAVASAEAQTAYYRMCEIAEASKKKGLSIRKRSFGNSRMSNLRRSSGSFRPRTQ